MIIKSTFKPAWWLKNRHLQTIWPSLIFRKRKINLLIEYLQLPDGDLLETSWTEPTPNPIATQDIPKAFQTEVGRTRERAADNTTPPLIVILHGMTGDQNSPYIKTILNAITKVGWQGVLMHFRGDDGDLHKTPRTTHGGDTADLHFLMHQLHSRFPERKIALLGFSIGGNVALKWLGEMGPNANKLISSALALSVPFDFEAAAFRLTQGFSRFYQWNLINKLRQTTLDRMKKVHLPIDVAALKSTKNFFQYDEIITAPLNGFSNALEYYELASCRQYLKDVSVPTLIIHSLDDPLMTPDTIPTEKEMSEHITLELSEQGGHLGFISGKNPFKCQYWFEQRVIDFFKMHFEDKF